MTSSSRVHVLVFVALGAVALSFTWSMVLQWVVKYEVPRHGSLFFQPVRWFELFGKAFTDFMVRDGGANEVGKFLMNTLAGPTLCFMLYVALSSARIRAAEGNYSLAIVEASVWILLDGFVAPSSAVPWYFAYRAAGCFLSSSAATKASIQPPQPNRKFSASWLVSLAVSGTYALILYLSALNAWRHLTMATSASALSHVSGAWRWAMSGGQHESLLHRLYDETKANPITRNLLYDSSFTMLAVSLHTALCLAQRMGNMGVGGVLALLLTPVLFVINALTAGSAWVAFLIASEMGLLGGAAASTAAASKKNSKKTQ